MICLFYKHLRCHGLVCSMLLWHLLIKLTYFFFEGAQWLCGRVLDSKPRDRGFEPHRRHCVVVLE